MYLIDCSTESLGGDRVRIVTTLDLSTGEGQVPAPSLGEGPTGDAIPDRIVKCLIDHAPDSVSLAEIRRYVGGNSATVGRQAWTLAENAPDLQHRLRGWVIKLERGQYALSLEAMRRRELI